MTPAEEDTHHKGPPHLSLCFCEKRRCQEASTAILRRTIQGS